ncbi:uncharacterized protein LOC120432369 [Culex pipiens pallens]|uniref:uncharacterized protein LOC120432369 n=1 Tax=Culex pipiens pallens TaxID=42434 RepID=UPI001954D043|nr:uncharacterized protein LOC120432369 [Culex pipiens pallens]
MVLAIELTFYPFFALIWVSKLYCGSVTVVILLIGMRTELQILLQYYGCLTNFMVTLQPIYEKLFFIIYYQSLVVAGTVSYVIIREEFDLCSVAIILCTSISILECYWWCHLVDTFKELNETIAGSLLGQCCQLPYSADRHSEYLQMRSTFMIVANISRHSVAFSCWGVFEISTAVFAKLLNISYSVLMFLINVYDGGNLV